VGVRGTDQGVLGKTALNKFLIAKTRLCEGGLMTHVLHFNFEPHTVKTARGRRLFSTNQAKYKTLKA
jgi:hypothetical protein